MTRFSEVVAKKKLRANLYFESNEHSAQTADDNSKVISRALQLTLLLYIFKLELYLYSIIIINQIKH